MVTVVESGRSSELDEVIDVTRRLIAAPSENPPGDERAVATVATRLLRERGLEVTTVAAEPHRPNIIARLDGRRRGPTLILAGHFDTKPVGIADAWRHDPFAGVVADGRLYGLGASDMKAGVAAVVVALGRIRAADGPRCGSVVGLLAADEEAGSTAGASFLTKAGSLHADAAVLAEPAGVDREWEHLYLGTRGSFLFRVDLEGVTGHSALEDYVGGTTATLALARLIERLDSAFRQLPGVAVNVGATVEGGVHYAVRAPSASFRGDVRLPPGVASVDAARVLHETLEGFLGEHADVRAKIVTDELSDGTFEALSLPADSAIAEACRTAAARTLGFIPEDGVYPAATDSFFLQGSAGIPTMPALGPGRLREAHQPNEYVSLESLEVAPSLLAAVADIYLDPRSHQ